MSTTIDICSIPYIYIALFLSVACLTKSSSAKTGQKLNHKKKWNIYFPNTLLWREKQNNLSMDTIAAKVEAANASVAIVGLGCDRRRGLFP